MKKLYLKLVFLLALGALTACSTPTGEVSKTGAERVVVVGGSATEIVYALGAENKLVGVDTSSIYPEAAAKLPQVGYQRTLSAEGVLSLKPTLVIVLPEAGPPAALQQIEAAGIKVVKITGGNSIDGAKEKIRGIAKVLQVEARGEEVVKKLENDVAEAQKLVTAAKTKPKAVFIYARGTGAPNVSGQDTAADAMIKLAGGENAITGFSEYKPLTPEAMVAAQPDAILLPSRGLESMGGIDGVLKLPGVAETPAGKNKKIIAIDDMLLLGFSPRVGQGIRELCEKLHN